MRRRRLLVALLLLIAIAGGLWWNSTRLNETERKLVGVWEFIGWNRQPAALILIADRRIFLAQNGGGNWNCEPKPFAQWSASTGSLRFLYPTRGLPSTSLMEWRDYVIALWDGDYVRETQISLFVDDEIEHDARDPSEAYHRSTDPELLAIFDRLAAGESP